MAVKEMLETKWMTRAACRGLNSLMCLPEYASRDERNAQIEQAKAVCARCPVIGECLEFALMSERPLADCVTAALSPRELIALRTERIADRTANRVPKCGTAQGHVRHLALGEPCAICRDAHNRRVSG